MRIIHALIITCLALTLTNCTTYDFSRRVVQQGNLLTGKKLNRLHIGMAKEDVSILMGSSLLTPDFNDDRWDYAYTIRKGSDPLKVKRVSLYFQKNQLVRINKNS